MIRLVVVLVCVSTATVLAKPKVAVAPVEGDTNGKVAELIVEALDDKAKVIGPKATGRAIRQLDASSPVTGSDAKRLREKLDADIVVQGTIEKDDGTRKLEVVVWPRGKRSSRFTIKYRTMPSKDDRRELRDELGKRLEVGDGDGDDDDNNNDDTPVFGAKRSDDDKLARTMRKDDDESKKRSKKADRADKADDDSKAKKKRTSKRADRDRDRDRDSDEESIEEDDDDADDDDRDKRRKQKLVAARVDAGLAYGLRRLTYTATTPPPRVGTAAPAGRVDGEVYPFVLSGTKGALAGLGVGGHYEKTFGLAIAVPGAGVDAPIDQADYGIGVRYQMPVGKASRITLGLDYARRKYIANRSALMNPGDLDAPDVDYKAFETSGAGSMPLTKTMRGFARVAGLLVRDTGGIQQDTSYGAATVFGLGLDAGIDYAISKQLSLRVGAEYTRISFTFKGNGDLAEQRGVTNATDSYLVGAATLGVTY